MATQVNWPDAADFAEPSVIALNITDPDYATPLVLRLQGGTMPSPDVPPFPGSAVLWGQIFPIEVDQNS